MTLNDTGLFTFESNAKYHQAVEKDREDTWMLQLRLKTYTNSKRKNP